MTITHNNHIHYPFYRHALSLSQSSIYWIRGIPITAGCLNVIKISKRLVRTGEESDNKSHVNFAHAKN